MDQQPAPAQAGKPVPPIKTFQSRAWEQECRVGNAHQIKRRAMPALHLTRKPGNAGRAGLRARQHSDLVRGAHPALTLNFQLLHLELFRTTIAAPLGQFLRKPWLRRLKTRPRHRQSVSRLRRTCPVFSSISRDPDKPGPGCPWPRFLQNSQ